MRIALLSFISFLCITYPAHGYDKLAAFLYPEYNLTVHQFSKASLDEVRSIIDQLGLSTTDEDRMNGFLNFLKDQVHNNKEQLASVFYKYDFSGDSVEDLIISDYLGSMEIKTFFWVKEGPAYRFAGIVEGTLQFSRSDVKAPLSLLARSGWCCAGYVGAIRVYTLKNSGGRLHYVLEKKILEMGGIKVPAAGQQPKRFVTVNDKYRLRAWPEVIDEFDPAMSDLCKTPVYGNTIAEFAKGSKGEARAAHTDRTGRVWWFVIMDKDATTTYNLFYGDEDGHKTGWMSSRYLKIVQ